MKKKEIKRKKKGKIPEKKEKKRKIEKVRFFIENHDKMVFLRLYM